VLPAIRLKLETIGLKGATDAKCTLTFSHKGVTVVGHERAENGHAHPIKFPGGKRVVIPDLPGIEGRVGENTVEARFDERGQGILHQRQGMK
jgi:hypothetical protein